MEFDVEPFLNILKKMLGFLADFCLGLTIKQTTRQMFEVQQLLIKTFVLQLLLHVEDFD